MLRRFIISSLIGEQNLINYRLVSNLIKINRFSSDSSSDDERNHIDDDFDLKIPSSATPLNRPVKKSFMIQRIQDLLECPYETAVEIYQENDKKFRVKSLRQVIETVEYIYSENISNASIVFNPFMLTLNKGYIEKKLKLLRRMKPSKIDHLLPLMKVNENKLHKICRVVEHEASYIPGGNRLYYFSQILQLPPEMVAKYFSTHTFMYDISVENFFRNLNVFIDYKVAPMNILRDLWAFKYKSSSIVRRLERAKTAQKEKIMPWMVRCPENVLEKSLQLSTESKVLFGDNQTIVDYLALRLGYDKETTNYIVSKHPSVLKVRAGKAKEVLDYLLNEAGFTPHHIAQVPRILCHSLETTRERLEELKTYNCVPSSLVIVCLSQREYQKFLTNWIRNEYRIKTSGDDEKSQHQRQF